MRRQDAQQNEEKNILTFAVVFAQTERKRGTRREEEKADSKIKFKFFSMKYFVHKKKENEEERKRGTFSTVQVNHVHDSLCHFSLILSHSFLSFFLFLRSFSCHQFSNFVCTLHTLFYTSISVLKKKKKKKRKKCVCVGMCGHQFC